MHYNCKAIMQKYIIVFFIDFLILPIVDSSDSHCQWVQMINAQRNRLLSASLC